MKKDKYLLSFKSTHKAIRARKICSKERVRIINTPKEISKSCAMSIIISKEDLLKFKNELQDLAGFNIFIIKKMDGVQKYQATDMPS